MLRLVREQRIQTRPRRIEIPANQNHVASVGKPRVRKHRFQLAMAQGIVPRQVSQVQIGDGERRRCCQESDDLRDTLTVVGMLRQLQRRAVERLPPAEHSQPGPRVPPLAINQPMLAPRRTPPDVAVQAVRQESTRADGPIDIHQGFLEQDDVRVEAGKLLAQPPQPASVGTITLAGVDRDDAHPRRNPPRRTASENARRR